MKRIILIFIAVLMIPKIVQSTDKIIESEMRELNLTSFIKEGEKFTTESFKDIDFDEVLKLAVSGKIETKKFYLSVIEILGREITSAITIIGGILVIIIIHSILKNITENIGNTNIAQIAYFVEYILIVTLVMTSFNEVITIVKLTINNLVTYINILIPLLLSLIATTGTVATASMLEPIILGIIIFIGNGINLYILPLLLISLVLGIVSNISDKIQIKKLSKMLKSSIVWIIGFIFTMFVSVLSLQGTLTSSVDKLTIKGLKTATSTFVPVIGKVLGDSVETVLRGNISNKKCSRNCWHNCNYWNMCYTNYKNHSFNSFI